MKTEAFFMICFIAWLPLCHAQKAYSDLDMKRNIPPEDIEYQLSDSPFTLTDTSIVSDSVVYVHSDYLCGLECDSMCFFLRFMGDGRVFWSFPYLSYPTKEEFNNLNYGKYGRFIVEDGKVIIEIYTNKQHGVMFMYAKPVSSGIQFYASSYRKNALIKKKSKDGGLYKKYYIRGAE